MKAWYAIKGWKTLAGGLLLALLSVFSNAEMQAWVAQNMEWVGGSVGTVIIILRALTTSPIGRAKPNVRDR